MADGFSFSAARIQDDHNCKGLLSDRGEEKQVLYLQKFYRDLVTETPAQQK